MRIVVFGLAVSSSWGNGHAALWRGLVRALHEDGHHVNFFERDAPYYAEHRDLHALPGGALELYSDWSEARAARAIDAADAVIITSFCPDAIAATELLTASPRPIRCFYDMDTPVTLAQLEAEGAAPYIGPDGLAGFDLVFSYTGGAALAALERRLGARRALPLYGWVDPNTHHPASPEPRYRADLSYIGTYAADRQARLARLFLEPARARPKARFVLAGAMYPADFPWSGNIFFVRHLPPAEHPAFYASSRLTLNVTRAPMAAMGWCPSGRLFEAAACGAPLLTDAWPGLDEFFEPGREVFVAASREEALDALDRSDAELAATAARARARVLAQHTATHRARQLVAALDGAELRTAA